LWFRWTRVTLSHQWQTWLDSFNGAHEQRLAAVALGGDPHECTECDETFVDRGACAARRADVNEEPRPHPSPATFGRRMVTPEKHMLLRSRGVTAILALGLVLPFAGSLAGCVDNKSPRGNQADGGTEATVGFDEVKKSFDGLTPRMDKTRAEFASLHKRIDPLPASAPGFRNVRMNFYNTDEGFSVIQMKLPWLSGQLDAASKSGDKAALQKVAQDIASTYADLDKIDGIALALAHEIAPFEHDEQLRELEITGATPYTHTLQTGFDIVGTKDGIEHRLIEFADDPAQKIDKTKWFIFDNLRFANEGLDARSGVSEHQLRNVFEILKAYPAMTLAIGGFSDNTGDPADSKKRTNERAQAVVAALVGFGVEPPRLEAEGFGPEHPVCPANDTVACKSRNRRVAANVTAK
jgi:outer membrane protein OmpA-like peptidoglycan-associated protein